MNKRIRKTLLKLCTLAAKHFGPNCHVSMSDLVWTRCVLYNPTPAFYVANPFYEKRYESWKGISTIFLHTFTYWLPNRIYQKWLKVNKNDASPNFSTIWICEAMESCRPLNHLCSQCSIEQQCKHLVPLFFLNGKSATPKTKHAWC